MSGSWMRRRLLPAAVCCLALTAPGWSQDRAVRREPFLTDAYLAEVNQRLADEAAWTRRVLFLGNSITLRHDVPARVAALAAAEGVTLEIVMAAANGARLSETAQIAGVSELLRQGWDVLVLQDFTTTALSAAARRRSEAAMVGLVALAAPRKVLLYPPWPRAPGHSLYRGGGAADMDVVPVDPADFARRTMEFYRSVASAHGFDVAPVPEAWLAAVAEQRAVYDTDNYHASAEGAELAARVLWESLRKELVPTG